MPLFHGNHVEWFTVEVDQQRQVSSRRPSDCQQYSKPNYRKRLCPSWGKTENTNPYLTWMHSPNHQMRSNSKMTGKRGKFVPSQQVSFFRTFREIAIYKWQWNLLHTTDWLVGTSAGAWLVGTWPLATIVVASIFISSCSFAVVGRWQAAVAYLLQFNEWRCLQAFYWRCLSIFIYSDCLAFI